MTISFLNSFRIHNPWLDLCLIPYDDSCDKVIGLQDVYGFSVYDDLQTLTRCDSISKAFFSGQVYGQFRKLAAFEGMYDEFIYIDSDTVVLKDIYPTFQLLKYFDYIFASSDLPSLRPGVWKDSIADLGVLGDGQIAFSANTGFFCSCRGTLTVSAAETKLAEAVKISDHMELLCMEQPFLNYLVVTSGKAYTSLGKLRREFDLTSIPMEIWAGATDLPKDCKPFHDDLDDVLFVHWAGLRGTPPRWPRLDRWAQRLGILPLRHEGNILPKQKLWSYYRTLDPTSGLARKLQAMRASAMRARD